ncbi:hypothetical protein FHETE_5906 [Fusarium heterosporum]|uniref:Uncharacterized protein n=1 Tax=Fusarium heterosporum TaxID=42747 RepID=A0A8H5WR29_FUSHE|nr:hypothetical protein FHETE_5906 [Fusarium heterosporum]
MPQAYMERIHNLQGKNPQDCDIWNKDEKSQEKYYSTTSYCYFAVSEVIETLANVPWHENTPISPEGEFGVLDTMTRWPPKTVRQKSAEDATITSELWFEALALAHHIPNYPISGEFIRGVREFKKTRQVSFSLRFAAQMNLDIHHAIGNSAEYFTRVLIRRLRYMDKLLKSTVDELGRIESPHWSSSDQKWLKDTQQGFEWFLDDPLHTVKTEVVEQSLEGLRKLAKTKKYRLLRRSPIINGLVLYHHRAEMYDAGLKVTNAWKSLILPAHLYNAVTEGGCCECFWPDMEQLFYMFGDEQFFVGGKLQKISDYVTRFMLQLGVAAFSLTSSRRSKQISIDDFSRAGARFLATRASIHCRFKDR